MEEYTVANADLPVGSRVTSLSKTLVILYEAFC